MHGKARLLSGEQYDAARMPENDCRGDVARVEHVLDREVIGMVARDQFRNTLVDLTQAGGERVARFRPDHAALDEPHSKARRAPSASVPPVLADETVAGDGGARIDAQD